MFKFLVVAGLCALAQAVPKYGGYGYGAGSYGYGGYGLAGGYGLGSGALIGGGLASGLALGGGALIGGGVGLAAAGGPIQGAIQSRQSVQVYDVPSSGPVAPINIDIGANTIPVNMMFRSRSSALNVQQMHEGQAGSFQETASQDEAHVLRHTVNKPVIQEVREVISPFRRITQTVQPVQESIETLVARNAGGAPAGNAIASVAAPVGAVGAVAAGPALAGGALGGATIAAAPVAAVAAGPAIATGGALLGAGLGRAGYGGYGYSTGFGYGAGSYGLAGGKLYNKMYSKY